MTDSTTPSTTPDPAGKDTAATEEATTTPTTTAETPDEKTPQAEPSARPAEVVSDDTVESVVATEVPAAGAEPPSQRVAKSDVPEEDVAKPASEPAATETDTDTEVTKPAPEPEPTAAPGPAEPGGPTPEQPAEVPPTDASGPTDVGAPSSKQAERGPGAGDEGPAGEHSPSGPAPHPAPRPKPGPGGQGPRGPKGHPKPMPRPTKPAVVAPPQPPVDPKAEEEAKAFGRVDDEGRVFLIAQGEEAERQVGQYAAEGDKDDALAVYVRRYLDLVAQVGLLESRVESVNPNELNSGLKTLEESLVEPDVVGDIVALRSRVSALSSRLAERRVEFEAERKAAKEEALAHRTAIIEKAEAIAAQDPAKTHWRDSRQELTNLLDEWKTAQKSGTRIDRKTEDGLWKRFSRARTEFDRHRRQHFSKVEAERKDVAARKEALIKRAESLSDSTDWSGTAAEYRALLEEWKRAGRMSRKDDDKLWARFRAAQQVFFDARQAHYNTIDSEQQDNLKAKLELVKEAQELLPIKDIAAAKEKLHSIQDRWEDIGFVPRKDIARTEGELRKVESAIRAAEDEQWRKSDPTKKERTNDFTAQLHAAIARHEEELAEAKKSGDTAAIAAAQEALDARRAWLDQLS